MHPQAEVAVAVRFCNGDGAGGIACCIRVYEFRVGGGRGSVWLWLEVPGNAPELDAPDAPPGQPAAACSVKAGVAWLEAVGSPSQGRTWARARTRRVLPLSWLVWIMAFTSTVYHVIRVPPLRCFQSCRSLIVPPALFFKFVSCGIQLSCMFTHPPASSCHCQTSAWLKAHVITDPLVVSDVVLCS